MNLTDVEEKLLKKIVKAELITKNELREYLKNNGNSGSSVLVDSATKSLLDKSLISTIAPLGSTCFIITQQGNKFLNDME